MKANGKKLLLLGVLCLFLMGRGQNTWAMGFGKNNNPNYEEKKNEENKEEENVDGKIEENSDNLLNDPQNYSAEELSVFQKIREQEKKRLNTSATIETKE